MMSSGVLFEADTVPDYTTIVEKDREARSRGDKTPYKMQIFWPNVIFLSVAHLLALYGLKLLFTDAMPQTVIWTFFMWVLGIWGIAVGSHRLWSHRSFKARLPLRIFLTICHSIAFQTSILEWARDHRAHHKFVETDGDPVNAERGLFFAHIGWLMCKKHPEVIRLGKTIDVSDLESDPCVAFQKRHLVTLGLTLCFAMPTVVPALLWGESLLTAYLTAGVFRFVMNLNGLFLINSLAHWTGSRPYDKTLAAAENYICNIFVMGDGFHNYHHVFPWDYKTGEYGQYLTNLNTAFIDLMWVLGQAHDLKTASQDAVRARALRTGDGSHRVWGWGDSDVPAEHRALTRSQ